MAEAADHQVQQQAEHAADQAQVEPLEVVEDEIRGVLEEGASLFGEYCAKHYEADDQELGGHGYGGV
ncbi:hypothetical protein D3C80_2047170 [compost metagenome]